MPVNSLTREFRALLAEEEAQDDQRYIDLCVVWRRAATGEVLLKVGGRWDLIAQRYVGPAEHCRCIDLKESQVEAARWAAYWITEKQAGRPRDFFSLFLLGDRGGGKTTFAAILIGTLLVAFPRLDATPAIAWQVSSSHAERDELDREMATHFPTTWFRYTEWPKHVYRWVHGPTLTNVSADDPDALKRGRVDFALFNEPQKMGKKAPAFGIARLKDKGGFTVFAANPPDDQKGRWVYDLWEKSEEAKAEGKPFPIRFLKLKSQDNDSLDTGVADQVAEIIRILDPRLASADLDGHMLRPGQPAYWQWARSKNLRPMPQLGDITRTFLQQRIGRAYDYLAGLDFQGTPHQACVLYKVFGTLDEPILWAVDEIVADQASEEDLIAEIAEAGYTPEKVLFVGDASGQWQDGKHSKQRDSFRVFKDHRWHIIPPTKPKTKDRVARNPPVEQRVKLVNKLLSDARLMVDPDTCPKLAEAFKECELRMGRYGRVVPLGFYAHLTDAASYPLWWACSKSHRPPTGSIGESVEIPRRPAW